MLFDKFFEKYKGKMVSRKIIQKIVIKLKQMEKSPLPFLAFHINLSFARLNHEKNKSVDYFFKIFEMGMKRQYFNDKRFWKMLL